MPPGNGRYRLVGATYTRERETCLAGIAGLWCAHVADHRRRFLDRRRCVKVVETDTEEGRDHFSTMIEQFLRMNAPQAILDWHTERQESAVFVTVADEEDCGDAMFQFVAADGGDVFVGYSSAAHEATALPLVRSE